MLLSSADSDVENNSSSACNTSFDVIDDETQPDGSFASQSNPYQQIPDGM